jgi:hypothetical protein
MLTDQETRMYWARCKHYLNQLFWPSNLKDRGKPRETAVRKRVLKWKPNPSIKLHTEAISSSRSRTVT